MRDAEHEARDPHLNEQGVCIACGAHEQRKEVDGDARRSEPSSFAERYRRDGETWDGTVPVSGGKDMRCIRSCARCSWVESAGVGQRRPPCDLSLTSGVETSSETPTTPRCRLRVERLSPNPIVRGAAEPDWSHGGWAHNLRPERCGDLSPIPIRAAVQFNVPLVVWGENSQERVWRSGGTPPETLTFERGGGLKNLECGAAWGLRVSDLSTTHGIEPKSRRRAHQYPERRGVAARVGVTGSFQVTATPWDGSWLERTHCPGARLLDISIELSRDR